MPYNNRCPDCGAFLDYGEKCECVKECVTNDDGNSKDFTDDNAHIGYMVHM